MRHHFLQHDRHWALRDGFKGVVRDKHTQSTSLLEGGSAHPISVLSRSVASYLCRFMLTYAHSDDSNNDAGTHYLTNTVDDLDRDGMEGAKYMHSPAPRTKEDHASLWHHIRTGTLGRSVCGQ